MQGNWGGVDGANQQVRTRDKATQIRKLTPGLMSGRILGGARIVLVFSPTTSTMETLPTLVGQLASQPSSALVGRAEGCRMEASRSSNLATLKGTLHLLFFCAHGAGCLGEGLNAESTKKGSKVPMKMKSLPRLHAALAQPWPSEGLSGWTLSHWQTDWPSFAHFFIDHTFYLFGHDNAMFLNCTHLSSLTHLQFIHSIKTQNGQGQDAFDHHCYYEHHRP